MTGRHPLSNGLCHTLPHETISHCSIRFMFPCVTKNGFVAVKQTKNGWNHRLRHHSRPRHCGLLALGRFEDALFDQQLIFANQLVAVDLQSRQSVDNSGVALRLRLPEKLLLFEDIFVFRFFVVWNSFFSLIFSLHTC